MAFYAVAVGKEPGIYTSWNECHSLVNGYPNAKYKKFKTLVEANEFINNNCQSEYSKDTKTDYYVYT